MNRDPIDDLMTLTPHAEAHTYSVWHTSPSTKPHLRLSAAQRRAAARDWEYFEVELFAHLAEEAPQLLIGPWRLLHELVRAGDKYLIDPSVSVGTIEDGSTAHRAPYIDVDALFADWTSLKQRVWLLS